MSISSSLMAQKVHNARSFVKSKRTEFLCILHDMNFDDRPETAIRLEKARKKRGFATAKDAAKYFGWSHHTYIQHENGLRGYGRVSDQYAEAFRVSEGWLLTGEGQGLNDNRVVPIVGYVGAGAEIEPDFEQVPPDGLDQIDVPFALPEDMVALEVRGDSMLPMYESGMILIVYREQRRSVESFYGERAVVRTTDGRRFVKTIIRGAAGTVSLLSSNAPPIENVAIEWIGEIFTIFPAKSVRFTSKQVQRQGGIQGQLQLKTG